MEGTAVLGLTLPQILGIAGVIMTVIAVILFARKINDRNIRKAFAKIFGFGPPSPKYQCLDRLREAQQRVDKVLKVLAIQYADADLWQRKAAEEARGAKSPLERKGHKHNVGWFRQGVKRAKAKFWRAHKLAKAFGFAVNPKYTDYLPPKLRWKVLGLPQLRRGGHGSA